MRARSTSTPSTPDIAGAMRFLQSALRPGAVLSSNRRIVIAVALVVVTNAVGLTVVLGVSPLTQATVLAVIAYAGLCAYPLARLAPRRVQQDAVALAVLCVALGIVLYVVVTFLALHLPSLGVLISAETAVRIAVVAMAPLAVIGWKALRSSASTRTDAAHSDTGRSVDVILVLITAAMACLISAATIYGYWNQRPERLEGLEEVESVAISSRGGRAERERGAASNWGREFDLVTHLHNFPLLMVENLHYGRPPVPFAAHRGTQVLVIGVLLPTQTFGGIGMADAAKVLSWLLLFCVLYMLAFMGRVVVGLPPPLVRLLPVIGVLFAPINTPPWALDFSSYRGMFPSAATLYFNITQLTSMSIALAGLVTLGLAVRSAGPAFPLGCALVGASLFFKPSFYSAAAPAIAVLWIAHPRRWNRSLLLGIAALSAPAVIWAFASAVAPRRYPIRVDLDPFVGVLAAGGWRFPGLDDNGALVAGIVTIASLAAVVPAAVDRIRPGHGTPLRTPAVPAPSGRTTQSLVVLVLAFGFASGLLFVQLGQSIAAGNLKWATAAGIIVALPLIVGFIARTENTLLRRTSWGLLCAQTLYGVHGLILYVTRSAL